MKIKAFLLVIGTVLAVIVYLGITRFANDKCSPNEVNSREQIGMVNENGDDSSKTNLTVRNTLGGRLTKIIPPKQNYSFKLLIGDTAFSFNEFSCVESSQNGVKEVFNSRENIDEWDLASIGSKNYGFTIKNAGVMLTEELDKWLESAKTSDPIKNNITLVLLDSTGKEKDRWNFYNAWPSKWDGPDFNAKGNEVAIETLTITCERVSRDGNDDDDGDDSN